ncbi:AAA family ATPase [Candidatus Pacearchaeota archaeon]|nr:AAA family ATPase [Candidatus Pacearchaeota archaeon]
MRLKKVINLFGGPGVGKSLVAAGLFYKMKVKGLNVEYVSEYAKMLTYEERFNILGGDQLYIFAKSHRKLLRLRDTVDYIISDSPILLPAVYYDINGGDIYHRMHFYNLVTSTFEQYPNLNIFLERNPKYKFKKEGRTQDSRESDIISHAIQNLLHEQHTYWKFMSDEKTVDEIFHKLKIHMALKAIDNM